jgi:hypothetical protein
VAFGGRAHALGGGVNNTLIEDRRAKHTNDARAEVPVVADDGDELLVSLLSSTIGIDEDRERLSDTNGVRELDEAATSEASRDKRLG